MFTDVQHQRLHISCTFFTCLGEAYLIFPPAYCQVTDGPGCFFLRAKVTLKHTFNVSNPSITQKLSEIKQDRLKMDTNLIEQVNDHGNQLGVNDGLHLLLVTCCDVGQEPHCLLQDKSINTRVSDDFLS